MASKYFLQRMAEIDAEREASKKPCDDGNLEPRLIARQCGGWLAISPEGASLRIGVTAETEDLARETFHQSIARWQKLFNASSADHP